MSMADAKALGRKLFGDRCNMFVDVASKLFMVGRFLDSGIGPDGKELLPHRRRQEIFGAGETLDEAFHFATGGATYSVAGMAPGPQGAKGYEPVYDGRGIRVVGWREPGSNIVTHRDFPGRRLRFGFSVN